MVVRVLGQRPLIAGQKGQGLSFILDCHLFQRVSGHVQQGDAPVLGLTGGLFGFPVRVGQQGQRRPGGEDEHQQKRKGALFCFHRPAPLSAAAQQYDHCTHGQHSRRKDEDEHQPQRGGGVVRDGDGRGLQRLGLHEGRPLLPGQSGHTAL